MRAYYAGITVVKASSPGLPDTTLTIPSRGAPNYEPARCPLASERPYHATNDRKTAPDVYQQYGLNNPATASSEAAGHSAQLANDGDEKSSWQAADRTTGAWWLVDLERNVAIQQVALQFPDQGAWRVRVEVSVDKTTWKPFHDQPADESNTRSRVINHNPETGRFVRVTFTGQPAGKAAALAEFRAAGVLVKTP